MDIGGSARQAAGELSRGKIGGVPRALSEKKSSGRKRGWLESSVEVSGQTPDEEYYQISSSIVETAFGRAIAFGFSESRRRQASKSQSLRLPGLGFQA
ncbi:MAG: hypothetical protein LBU12_02175 [Deltaproteobacteria bacterium]|nr:hypothetical protein [Deltaproteobacteria bacterium]